MLWMESTFLPLGPGSIATRGGGGFRKEIILRSNSPWGFCPFHHAGGGGVQACPPPLIQTGLDPPPPKSAKDRRPCLVDIENCQCSVCLLASEGEAGGQGASHPIQSPPPCCITWSWIVASRLAPPPLRQQAESREQQQSDGVPGLQQGSAHQGKPKGVVRKTTVRWGSRAYTSRCLRNVGGGRGVKPRWVTVETTT